MQKMNFGEALEALKAGKKVKRKSWDTFLFIKTDDYSRFPVIYTDISQQEPKIYDPHQDDLLAEDWVVVSPSKMTFEEAIEAVKNGKTVRHVLCDDVFGYIYYYLTPESLAAKAWVIVD